MIVRAACVRRSRCAACFPFADFAGACFPGAGDCSGGDVTAVATATAFLIPFFIPECGVVVIVVVVGDDDDNDDDGWCRLFTLKDFIL